ncbi:MAG: aldehyde dehydrogenase family protein [Robiginitomaculum sp.]|nr:aldehyde dehydrogenase family protein [Robiginitomaculum sp.]
MTIKSINPATGKIIKLYEPYSDHEIASVMTCAYQAFETWRRTDYVERKQLVHNLADVLKDTADSSAALMTAEMGKTIKSSHAELEKCIEYCRFTADNAEKFLADTLTQTEYKQAFTRPLPLGPILLVMPWNFPFWQVLRVAVAATLAGNTCILKHASNVSGCSLALASLFEQAGFPKGIFQSVLMSSKSVCALIGDKHIAAVSLTGSHAAGSAVASECGKHIKKCVLELGGSDPFIVMPSADIDAAIDAAIISRMRNNGQSCIAAKRLIVHTDIFDDFKSGFIDRMNRLKIGNPLNPDCEMGPLSSKRALSQVTNMLSHAKIQGAKLTKGTQSLPENGFYLHPSLLEDVDKNMDIYGQEIFAPVAMLFRVNSFDEAVSLANDTEFGLSSVLFSHDAREQQKAITHLDAGSTYINRYASSDIRLPFGGIKSSGFGREMAGEGLREFTNLKTIILAS